MTNKLYYGDNLHVLQEHIADESVDLIYLDPPFNSNANYNILFKSPDGSDSDAQITAFDDTWSWGQEAEEAVDHVTMSGHTKTHDLLQAMLGFLGKNAMMAYLAMMAARLIELHRVLKPTGSLYLHCDPTASHYLKLLLDGVFHPENFRSEIVWLRSKNPKGSQHVNSRWGTATDTIFFYAKSSATSLNLDAAKTPTDDKELAIKFPKEDEIGRWADGPILRSSSMGPRPNLVYEYNGFTPGPAGWRCNLERLKELDKIGDIYWTKSGAPRRKIRPKDQELDPIGSCWTDIPPLNSQASERLGYPTQKPLALLERIISASSNEGDVVLDPFCGCGTAVDAAETLGRKWIGIDVTHLAVKLIEERMKDRHPDADFEVIGRPESLGGAEDLWERDPHEFEKWIVPTLEGHLFEGGRKGADGGIDGYIYFKPDGQKTEKAILSVKGGKNVGVAMIRDLVGTMEREKAAAAVFVTKVLPTKKMEEEAAKAGIFKSEYHGGRAYPRVQIITLAEIFQGKAAKLPQIISPFQKARRHKKVKEQGKLI
ncbi:MAG: DNA methyltransferase [Pacificimonas sp.]